MASVQASEHDVAALLESSDGGAVLAAVNAPNLVTISGTVEAIERALDALRERKVPARRLEVSHAFHSPLLDPALAAVEASAGRFPSRPPRLRWISTLTGAAFDAGRGPDPSYWRRQLREPVRFDAAVRRHAEGGGRVLLELGPTTVLASLARRAWPRDDGIFLTSLVRGQDDWRSVLKAAAELYVHGVDLEWPRVGDGFPRRRRPMPTYPFERERHWIDHRQPAPPRQASSVVATSRQHPLLGRRVADAGHDPRTIAQFESSIVLDSAPMLAGHRVEGAVVLPIAAFVEMALTSATVAMGDGPKRLRNLKMRRMLTITASEPLELSLRVEATATGKAHVDLRSTSGAAPRAVPVATADVERFDQEPVAAVDLATLRARCATTLAGRDFYAELRGNGFEYGTPFDAVTEVVTGDGEALGRVELTTDGDGEYFVHPALLDGCIQVAAAALAVEWRNSGDRAPALPARIESVWFRQRPSPQLWSHARVRPGATADRAVVDITVLDAASACVGELLGLHLVRRNVAAREATPAAAFEIHWRPREWQATSARTPARGPILVLTSDSRVGGALVADITAAGRRAIAPPFDMTSANAGWRDHLLAGGWSEVVYAPGDGDVADVCEGLRLIVAALDAHGSPPRLAVVTRDAQPVEASDTPLVPAHTALWGFTRSLALERPELRPLLVDTAADAAPEGIARLLADTGDEDEVALRRGCLFAPRLTSRPLSSPGNPLRADGTYIVTGGLGALGLAVGKRLIDQGARHLVLVGRAVRADAAETLKASHVRVMTAAADVTRAEDLDMLRECLRQERWPEVRGIVHAAGVLEDGTVGELHADVLRRVVAPKIDGVRNIARAFAGAALDFFVVFSSAAAALGSPGQAAYAAANAALDGWAHDRRRQGRPALSIGWSSWRGLGMAARASAATPAVDRDDALDAFDTLLASDAAHVIVLPADARAAAALGRRSLLAELRATEAVAPGASPATALREVLSGATPPERQPLVLAYVRDKAAAALGLASHAVDVTQPLTDLGLDSLMAMEVRAHVIEDIGITLPVASLLEQPTVARIAAEVMMRLEQHAVSVEPSPVAEVVPDEFPLSRNQMAMWFLQQLAPDSSAYHLGDAIQVAGTLDVPALRRAFDALTLRHPALRTTIVATDGEVRQRVHTRPPVSGFEHHERPGWEREKIVEELRSETERPFDLERGPLTRLLVLSRGVDEHYLLLSMHHVIGELWALILMVQELSHLYRAEIRGTPDVLPPLAHSYATFVAQERRLLTGPDGERMAAYWTRKLTPLAPPLTLPTAKPRPAVQTYRGALQAFALARETGEALKKLAREENTTLFAAMLAAFLVTLRRESGQTDLVVGSPMTGRTRPEWAGILGYFDNPVPLRVDMSGQPTFREVVRSARATVLEAFDHQAYPFPMIVDRVQPPRDPGRSPLFDAMFVLRKSPVSDLQRLTQLAMGGAGALLDLGDEFCATSLDLGRRVSQLDLTLAVTEEGGELFASWEYNTDLFDEAAIGLLTGHFLQILQAATARPDEPVDTLPMITDAERRIAVEEWNATSAPFPADRLLHQGFEEQVTHHPDALAVITDSRQMTYGELNGEAEAVARWLRQRGVGPNHLVAVVMHKGWEQVVAVLGVLKAGGAYVPIDAVLPEERMRYLLERCDVRCAITQPAVLERFAWPSGIDVLTVHTGLAIDDGAEPAPAARTQPSDLAYVIFTSGSTGVPKGVMIDHRGAWNTVYDVNTRFDVGPLDRVLALSSLSFDLSVYDVFGTLASGGAIVIPRAADAKDPAHWAELARRHDVTVWNSVPALLELLVRYVDTCPEASPTSLRLALLSGDWIPVMLPDRARARFPGVRVIGMGGATEASIWSILYPIGRVDPAWKSIPYGRPMANQSFFVLDAALDPCAVGVPGDLHIGGIGLALGYWKDEDRTSAAFFVHPRTGERLYRTGDLGRYLADGTIEFLGRADAQVKIRGFRVELGEIEAVLTRAPGVRQVVVTAREDEPGDGKRLVAYIVADAAEAPSADALRRAVGQSLPDYMLPSAFVFVDSLALSPNGKVDVRALPVPRSEHREIDTPYEAPRDSLEQRLAALWAEVLRLPRVGVYDDFFALGGDSIQSIQISVRGAQAGLRIRPRNVFEDATIAALAARLRSAPAEDAAGSDAYVAVPEVLRGDDNGSYALEDFPLASLSERQLQNIVARFHPHEG